MAQANGRLAGHARLWLRNQGRDQPVHRTGPRRLRARRPEEHVDRQLFGLETRARTKLVRISSGRLHDLHRNLQIGLFTNPQTFSEDRLDRAVRGRAKWEVGVRIIGRPMVKDAARV